jgi:hypothetical protein
MTEQPAQSDSLVDVLTDASRTQIAALSAAAEFWASWAESSASFSRGMAQELADISRSDTPTNEIIGRVTDLNREYLRKLTELPTLSVKQFEEELKKIDERANTRPQRRARAKS